MRKLSIHPVSRSRYLFLAIFISILGLLTVFVTSHVRAADPSSNERLITIHDRGKDRGILTQATTLRQAFVEADIAVDNNDLVEPGLDETLVASSYQVNIYRARPVIIVDGLSTQKVLSPYQTSKQIVEHAGLELHDEDITTVEPIADVVSHGAGLQVNIDRATPFTLVLYGKKTQAYTQASTVGEMMKQKDITLGQSDTVSLPEKTPITANMTVEIWRNGVQTLTEEQEVDFPIEKIQNADREVGFREVKTAGEKGKRTVTYEIVVKNGAEESRKEIQSVTTVEPKKQVEVVGAKTNGNPLTKSMGVKQFTDSNGVVHRETYYDLPMATVMRNCGSGGLYAVRSDEVKIDKDGYVIVAAHLGNYPRCSVVQTSLGLGKVYDTGGFVSAHPHGFDLATDWTNHNGV